MKQLFTILAFILATLSVFAQNNVFVLVDVSMSVKQSDLVGAKQALMDVLLGNQLSNSTAPGIQLSDLQQFKLIKGDKLYILKFGDQNTTRNISPQPLLIQNIPNDVYQAFNAYPTSPSDQNTYWKLAKAKIAEYAKKNGLSKYKLYVISDENEDNFGPGGKPNYIDSYTLELAESYNTIKNPAIEDPSIQVKINSTTQGFKLNFCPKVDISGYTLPGSAPTSIPDPNSDNAKITITSPPGAKKGKEYELKTETINVNWTCNNCPPGIKYTVTIFQYDGGKFKETKKDLVSNTATFKVPNGKYRITVSASNYNASSDNTHISLSTGSYGWVIFLLFLIAGVSIGYYYWNKKRKEKINAITINDADDIFTKKSGGTSTGNSTNSDYF